VTETKQTIIERVFTLIARSDQWGNFVGDTVSTKMVDRLIGVGDIKHAVVFLRGVGGKRMLPTQAMYIIRARQEYLNTRDVDHPRPDSQLITAIGDLLEEQVFATAEELPDDWEANRDQEDYLSSHLVPQEGWGEGRGYGDFPDVDLGNKGVDYD